MNKIKFFLLAASILLAMVFTFSCSDGGDDDSSGGEGISNEITQVYTLEKGDGYFTYIEKYDSYSCKEGGVLDTSVGENSKTINYSINNKVMIWQDEWSEDELDTLNFKGTSNELKGTWTRTPNKDLSCIEKTDEEESRTYYSCKENWNYKKIDFAETTVTITEEFCYTSDIVDGEEIMGLNAKVIDCNTYELSEGSEKLTVKIAQDGLLYSYKDKSCKDGASTKSQYQAACEKAWDEYGEDADSYMYKFLYEEFHECLHNMLPANFLDKMF